MSGDIVYVSRKIRYAVLYLLKFTQ
ncbi:MAG: DUF2129 domain-containing protein [Nitrospirae bacterium]|nr:DUF2129 domain-containing protein [Nitrospirota bacterium]